MPGHGGRALGAPWGLLGPGGLELMLGVPVEEVEGLGRGGVGHPHWVGRSPWRAGDAPCPVQAASEPASGSEPCTSKPWALCSVCLAGAVGPAGVVAGRVGPSQGKSMLFP